MATPTSETARAPDVTSGPGTAEGPSSGRTALPAARGATSATDSVTHRKIRGAFFTPTALCDHIVTWALRDRQDSVLEPACGEAAFLLAAARRLRALDAAAGHQPDSNLDRHPGCDNHGDRSHDGGRDERGRDERGNTGNLGDEAGQPRGNRQGGLPYRVQLHGVELHAPTASAAAMAVTASGERAEITVADFFAVPARPDFDAVVGNPPYVRYQKFHGEARGRAQVAAGQAGVRLTNLASSWAAFTVHAARFLRPAGRLGLVLPAELLAVNYAAPVRQFLLERFRHVQLVLFTERVFPGVQEEVLLLLAEGTGPADRFDVHQVRDLAELAAAEAGHTAGPAGGTTPGGGSPFDGDQPAERAVGPTGGVARQRAPGLPTGVGLPADVRRLAAVGRPALLVPTTAGTPAADGPPMVTGPSAADGPLAAAAPPAAIASPTAIASPAAVTAAAVVVHPAAGTGAPAPEPQASWMPALISVAARQAMLELTIAGLFGTLATWGRTTLGAVTGNNRYFALSRERADALGLGDDELVPISPPGSRHLRALTLRTSDWQRLTDTGLATLLFRPGPRPSPAARAYIAAGERNEVDLAYKCRIRSPWWQVPLPVTPADLLLTYMNADTPQLATNRAGVAHLNSVHGVVLTPDHRRAGRDLLPLAALNSVTMLAAETVGRAYGGGMLKLEPREAARLLVPAPELVERLRPQLSAARRGVLRALAAGRLTDAVAGVDEVLLVGGAGLGPAAIEQIVVARHALWSRRHARAGRADAPRSDPERSGDGPA
ncbi:MULTISPECIES: SAM-dependent methyltransferase [Protofrankia]|uniref:site-specific DNA-methyltransferase (adenine-specific) n=1 Tax=Candidatus Protofrankia datiscae TaxID=2716812 RepID=F8AUR8_9ACTN|nr:MULTISPECIES: SAM-dependent methyltransferase [Protofrankia]AEH08112.1 hypothetical protein FsymDg_0582 [Candidatus Protofrankia datiscae]